jgi:hypothetical protein|tara:strand:+ start:656 stop:772 length:117 start_codon:yes stop_codon:yes gene_type:complete
MDHCIVCNKETTYDFFHQATNICCDCIDVEDEDVEKEE